MRRRDLLLLLAWPALGAIVLGVKAVTAGLRRSALATVAALMVVGFAAGLAANTSTARVAARSAALAPFTAGGIAWGVANGETLRYYDGMVVVTGMEGGCGPRTTVTIGQAVLTRQHDMTAELLTHEKRHTYQWAAFGALMPPLYFAAGAFGGGPEGNVFEVAAGLEDGGYFDPPGGPRAVARGR